MASIHATQGAARSPFRRYRLVGLIFATIVVIFLLTRLSCSRTEPPSPDREPNAGALLVPAEMTSKFGLQGDEVVTHCRQKIRDEEYDGILRGAYGALWTGRGNVWDRTLLAAAALKAEGTTVKVIPENPPKLVIASDSSWQVMSLDSSQRKTVDQLPKAAVDTSKLHRRHPELFHRFEPILHLQTASGESVDVRATNVEPVAEWLYQPVVLSVEEDAGGLYYSLRVYGRNGARAVLQSKSLKNIRKAELHLSWRFGKSSRVWKRELFDRANGSDGVPGHSAARAGDRYAIAVALGPLDPEVLATRAQMLQRENSYTPVKDEITRNLIQMGTRYFIDSDAHTKKLAAKTHVKVTANEPRIAITAYEPTNEKSKSTDPAGFSMDIISNDVEALGERAKEFQVARGLANDMIESHVLFQATKLPVISASTVFSKLRAATPETPERRIALIRKESLRMLKEEPIGTRVRLTAFLPRHATDAANREDRPTSLSIERSPSGLVLHGVTATPQAANKRLTARRTSPPYEWDTTGSTVFGTNVSEMAVVADSMLAHQKECADYHLQFRLLRALSWEPIPLTTGCVVKYRVTHKTNGKEQRYSINVPVLLNKGRATGKWLTIPVGQHWVSVSSDNSGDVRGAWPEVVGIVKGKGPTLEAFLASDRITINGTRRSFKLRLGTRTATITATEVKLGAQKPSLIEVRSGRKWVPAVFVRHDGLLSRRSGRYEVRLLGSDLKTSKRISGEQWRWLNPCESQVNGVWSLANALETKDGKTRIQICGSDEASRWVDDARVRPARVAEVRRDGKWRVASVLKKDDKSKHHIHFSGTPDKSDVWLAAQDIRIPGQDVPKDGKAILLDAHRFPLVLAWKRGNTTVVLDKITPVVTGRVTDGRTGLPVSGAVVSRSDGKWSVQTAADGAFGIPVDDPIRPMSQVVGSSAARVRHPSYRKNRTFNVLVLADPPGLANDSDDNKQDWCSRAADSLNRLLRSLARPGRGIFGGDRVRMGLWSIGSTKNSNSAVTEELKLPSRKDAVLKKINSLSRVGTQNLSTAFVEVARQCRSGKLPKDLIVVLLTTGNNSGRSSVSDVYRKWKCSFPVHIFEISSKATAAPNEEMRELALTSGGTCLTLPAKAEHVGSAAQSTKLVSVKLLVKAQGYETAKIIMPMLEAGKRSANVTLTSACPCHRKKDGPTDLLVITDKNTGDLKRCTGLSAKARRLIEDRVKDGRWTVTIPNHRVNVGGVTAYAWYEAETATGRMIGRTEDGLHGAVPSPRWPKYRPRIGTNQPFVAWYEGLVAYTAGSVLSAMRWHNEPGFPGTAEDFKRFVQANALEYALDWWGEVASELYPGLGNFYWSGVCLNFSLQSKAFGMPSDACHRRWAEDLCSRLLNEAKDHTVDELKNLLNSKFKSEWRSFTKAVGDKIADALLSQFESHWDEGVKTTCRELVNGVFGKAP